MFAKDNINYIPEWINSIDINQIEPVDKIQVPFEKQAAFNTAPKVSRDDRDFNSRPVVNNLNNTRFVLAAKTELAKFLAGHYYTTEVKTSPSVVELTASISNVPATFSFKYTIDRGRVKAAKLFYINANNEDGEYPFNKAGLNDCLTDLKNGTIKTATKAKSYTAYTITLEEVVRRFNGDQRAAMDKVRELVASQDLIGVGSNTFATCYALDSLFPRMKKEGGLDNAPTFEFVKNKEHVAANPNATAASLIVNASKQLHKLFKDFKILTFEKTDNKLVVTADILHKNHRKHVAFNFGIENDQLQGIAYVNDNDNNIPLKTFLEDTEISNVLTEFNKENHLDKYLHDGIILTKDLITRKLRDIVTAETIQRIIDHWIDYELITPVNSNTYISKLSFTDLLNHVNTRLMTKDEYDALYQYSQRMTSYLERIKEEDNIRDYNIVFSPMIRLTNLYNRLSNFIKHFSVQNINNDCTKVYITSFSERGPEDICICASYNGNQVDKITTTDKKNITAALNLYKKEHKNNIFAKSVFSKRMLMNTLSTIFENADFETIKSKFSLQKLGNEFYACQYPISAIINKLASDNIAKTLTSEKRKELLSKFARNNNTVSASYIKDIIRNNLEFSRVIRLANVYNVLSKKLNNFSLVKYNKDCSKIRLNVTDEHGIHPITVTVSFDDNKCINVNIPKNVEDSTGLTMYKQANSKNNVVANAVFSKRALLNIFSNIFKNPEEAANVVLTKVAKNIGNNFYVSKFPLATIIDSLSRHNFAVLTKEEHQELLDLQSVFGKKITAAYEKDNDTRRKVAISKSIRLANVYAHLSKKYSNFHFTNVNDDVTDIECAQLVPVGLTKFNVKVAYNNNQPIEFTINNETIPVTNELAAAYMNEKGTNQKVAKSIFTKNMVKSILQTKVASKKLDSAINQVLEQANKLDANYYACDKPLVSLLNNINIPVELSYDEHWKVQDQFKRENVKDTGTREIEFTDNLISAMNKASQYLSKFFNQFKVDMAKLSNEKLSYSAVVFDEQTGISNPIQFLFSFDDSGNIIDCQANIQKTFVPIEKVKMAFASNDILSRYLQYNTGKKVNAPIVISTNRLINKLKPLTNKTKDELMEIIASWEKQNRIYKIAFNAYASNYTVEQLLSMSSLKALTDEEIRKSLNRTHNLLKVSAAYVKDNDTRSLNEEWTLDKYVAFIRAKLNQISNYSRVLNASIDNNKLSVTAEIGYRGLRHDFYLSWDISNGKPEKCQYKLPYISPMLQKYTEKYAGNNNFSVQFTLPQLENNLLGYADKESIHKACNLFVDKEILTKVGENYYAKYSVAELLRFMEKYKLIDDKKVQAELKLANRHISIDTTSYKVNDTARQIETASKDYMNNARDKLYQNIKLAKDNKLVTARTADKWLKLLENVENVVQVHKELTAYLSS